MSHVSKKWLRLAPWLLVLLVIGGGLLWLNRPSHDPAPPVAVPPEQPAPPQAALDADPATPEDEPPAASPAGKIPAPDERHEPDPTLLANFKAFHARLQAGMSREEALAALKAMKQQVHDLPPEIAAATLIALLDSGDDAATGLEFAVGDEGVLDEAPTYRLALLDFLGQTEPESALAYSRSLLAKTDRPDEYALSLRNVAWLNHENELNDELVSAFSTLLDREAWRTAPTDGFLEAFDVAVAVGGPHMLTELVSVLRLTTPDGKVTEPSVNRAAFIALDRVMLREPEMIAGIYTADPSFMDFAPNHRASILSRLDPGSPAQADALRTFLRMTPADAPELAYFGRIFPNANFFEGNRLVTSWENPTASRTRERDANALAFANDLLNDPAYSHSAPALQKIRTRLESFAE